MTDDFFELGGGSIDIVQLFPIQEAFPIELTNSAVFKALASHELPALINAASASQGSSG